MFNLKSFIKMFIILFIVEFVNISLLAQNNNNNEHALQPDQTSIEKAQPVEPKVANELIGQWWTDSKDAIFAKIVFGQNGGFTGYSLQTDKSPYATGTYRIINGGLYITVNDRTMNSTKPTQTEYKFASYTISDNKLQLLSETMDKAYNYYRSPENK